MLDFALKLIAFGHRSNLWRTRRREAGYANVMLRCARQMQLLQMPPR